MNTNTKKSQSANLAGANKKKKILQTENLLEALRDIGGNSFESINKDVFEGIPRDFANELLGWERPKSKSGGDLLPGQTLKIEQARHEESEENKKLRSQISLDRQLRHEEQQIILKRGQELRVEIHALTNEVEKLAITTQGLSQNTKIAVTQAPAHPGIYHIVFFQKLRGYISSFRANMENASNWMQSYNERSAKKKGYWGQVQKSGAKRLLSPEDYTQRSAG